MDEVDLAILDIINRDSPLIDGLDLPESGQVEVLPTVTVAPEIAAPQASNINANRKRSAQPSTASFETKEKKLRLEMMEIEIYHRKLQCLKLERELNLNTSIYTRNITPLSLSNETEIVLSFEEL